MSKRAGNIFSISDLLKLVNLDYAKWIILSYNVQKVIKLDINNITTHNTVLDLKNYINYIQNIEYISLEDDIESEKLFSMCLYWPIIVKKSLKLLDLHIILDFAGKILHELGKQFYSPRVHEKHRNTLNSAFDILIFISNILDVNVNSDA